MSKITLIFTSVFHRILDFKAGLNVYSGPFFLPLTVRHAALLTTVVGLSGNLSLLLLQSATNTHHKFAYYAKQYSFGFSTLLLYLMSALFDHCTPSIYRKRKGPEESGPFIY